MIVVGSHALKIGLEKIGRPLDRTPVDLDLFGSHSEALELLHKGDLSVVKASEEKMIAKAPDGKMVEIEYVRPGTSTAVYYLWAEVIGELDVREFYGMKMGIAPLEMLYSLKKAHRHSPRNFKKHVNDYNFLRCLFYGKDVFPKVTTMRYNETVQRERLRTPSLNKSTEEFFDDSVSNRTFVHDHIHEIMAFGARPMFEQIKIDPNKVACSKQKFFALEKHQRRQCVQEEAYVIALERCMIPMLFEGAAIANPRKSYEWAVMRICTTLCSGWFREWALENYNLLMFWYDAGYVEKFLKAVEDGRIERIQK